LHAWPFLPRPVLLGTIYPSSFAPDHHDPRWPSTENNSFGARHSAPSASQARLHLLYFLQRTEPRDKIVQELPAFPLEFRCPNNELEAMKRSP
jgi:hypothetical protein